MFNWKVEDMALMNEASYLFKGDERLFECELELSKEDKIAFVDSMQNGNLSYLLALIDKYEAEAKDLPKTKNGYIKTASLQAWLRKNDPKQLVDATYNIGHIKFFNTYEYWSLNNLHGIYNTHYDLVDEVFHRQLKECLKLEREYFEEHDEYALTMTKLKQYINNYNIDFGVKFGITNNKVINIYDDNWENKRPITLDEINLLISKYEQLESYINTLAVQTNIKY